MTLYDADGAEVPLKWPPPSPPVHLPGGGAVNLTATATLADGAQLWSVARPYLYTVAVTIVAGAAAYGKEDGAPGLVTGAGVDAFNLTVGARAIRFDPARGLYLNGEAVKLRGFCDHSNFAAVGGALPDRLNLFRLQGLRGVGGNAWRMAHK